MSKRKVEATNDEQKKQQVPKLDFHWTPDLHCHFELAINSLGGPFEAKPSTIRETMETIGVSGLTTKNIKSHLQLQKYREKYRQQVSFADSLMIIGERQSPSLISNQIIGSAVGKMTVGAGSSNGVHGQIQKASVVKGNWIDGLNKFNQKQ